MKKLEVIDLLNIFNGPYHIYEPVRNEQGIIIDTDYVCGNLSHHRTKEKYMHRTVHDFTGCINHGINIYLD